MVRAVLARHPEVSEARVFGSRALERHRPESDVDLALYGDVDEVLANRIAGELDELPLPDAFDVCAYPQIRYVPLREHIARAGRRLFVREFRRLIQSLYPRCADRRARESAQAWTKFAASAGLEAQWAWT